MKKKITSQGALHSIFSAMLCASQPKQITPGSTPAAPFASVDIRQDLEVEKI